MSANKQFNQKLIERMKSMKKIFSLIMVSILVFSLSGLSVNANEPKDNKESYSIKVIDNSNNEEVEVTILSEVVNQIACIQSTDTEEQTVEYDVTFLLPVNNNTRSSISSEQENASIRAKITITYSMYGDREKIKVSGVSGSWACANDKYSMTFSNRTVSVTDGRPFGGSSITWYPDKNTFSFSTDWDYVDYYPASMDAMTGARAYSEATGTIVGMGGSYTLYVPVYVP